jgi:exodeoxyribonuclease-1
MAASYFFYDLETTGFDPKEARIMQFAGQRTDANLRAIGEPVNVLVKLTPDILPSPDAIFVTGITPQQTIIDGLTEAEFLNFFYTEVVAPDTTFLGFNSVRFDDEFMRYLHYRNYYDPYEWQWQQGCSRWDILDLVRMTRALRPDGIEWPLTPEGKPTNRLELLTKANGLGHEQAHDALSDVMATINVTKLIRDKQPDLFKYLFEHRNKKTVSEVVLKGAPFVYTSGHFPAAYWHTSAVELLARHPQQDSALIYDLRYDPTPFTTMSVAEIIKAWKFSKDPDHVQLPVKTLKYNRCPAVAPLGVMKAPATQDRLQLTLNTITKHRGLLHEQRQELSNKVLQALQLLDARREQEAAPAEVTLERVDSMLYQGGFIGGSDKTAMAVVRATDASKLATLKLKFTDTRLSTLWPLYLARNYPESLPDVERGLWEAYLHERLLGGAKQSRLAQYFERLGVLSKTTSTTDAQNYLLEELQLYGESIVPADTSNQDE